MCRGQRPRAPTVSAEPSASAAELGGAPGADTERDWRKPVSEHAALPAAAHAGRAEPRDSLSCRHSGPEGNKRPNTLKVQCEIFKQISRHLIESKILRQLNQRRSRITRSG